MALPLRIPTGAPGIYKLPDSPLRALTGVRMDVCAFVGVAPRGPVRVPVVNETWPDDVPCVEPGRPRRRTVAVPVESFDDYRRVFGGFEGPGLLPYSVAAFFEQGGRRAYVVRIVADYSNAAKNAGGVASGTVADGMLAPSMTLLARSEGTWGNRLRGALDFTTKPLIFEEPTLNGLSVDRNVALPAGSLLRLTLADKQRVLRFVVDVERIDREFKPGFLMKATFDQALPSAIETAEVVEAVLVIDDGDGRVERHEQLGLSALHPHWLATVLCYESQLVYPEASWSSGFLKPSNVDLLPSALGESFTGGLDRYADITPEDFFDPLWTLGNDEPGSGVHALTHLSDLSIVVVPDLYSPAPLVEVEDVIEPISLAGPEFVTCVDLPQQPLEQTEAEDDLLGLRLDPGNPADLAEIIKYQQRLHDLAESLRSFVVLIDVPPGLNQYHILRWRTNFDSAFVAAYHPWLKVSRRDDSRDALLRVPPAAVAAGVIARQELAFGVPHGPANVIAAEVISLDDRVSPARHDELHPQGINIYLQERDGVRLTAARTLSRIPSLRQLSVRRLLTMIKRALEQQMQWVVFEPNNTALRFEVRLALESYLRQLFRLGAFRGATEAQAFFVICDDTNNSQATMDNGELIAEIGVAPAEPLEFIVLRLARDADGTLTLKEK
jgi:hypothetical protein